MGRNTPPYTTLWALGPNQRWHTDSTNLFTQQLHRLQHWPPLANTCTSYPRCQLPLQFNQPRHQCQHNPLHWSRFRCSPSQQYRQSHSLLHCSTIELALLFNQFLCHATTTQASAALSYPCRSTATPTLSQPPIITSKLHQLCKLYLPSTPCQPAPDFASSANSACSTNSDNSAHSANPIQQPTVYSLATPDSSVYPATANTQQWVC